MVQRPCYAIVCPLCGKEVYDITEDSMYDRLRMHAWGAHRLRPSEFDKEVDVGAKWVKTSRVSLAVVSRSPVEMVKEEADAQVRRALARDFRPHTESED